MLAILYEALVLSRRIPWINATLVCSSSHIRASFCTVTGLLFTFLPTLSDHTSIREDIIFTVQKILWNNRSRWELFKFTSASPSALSNHVNKEVREEWVGAIHHDIIARITWAEQANQRTKDKENYYYYYSPCTQAHSSASRRVSVSSHIDAR